jgi:hypothetical protein
VLLLRVRALLLHYLGLRVLLQRLGHRRLQRQLQLPQQRQLRLEPVREHRVLL